MSVYASSVLGQNRPQLAGCRLFQSFGRSTVPQQSSRAAKCISSASLPAACETMVSSLKAKWRKKAQQRGAPMVRTLQNKIRKKMALPPKAGRRTMRAKALARWAMRQFDYKLYGKCLEILSNWPRGGKALQRMILERPGIVLAISPPTNSLTNFRLK